MGRKKNLTGMRFGRLTVISEASPKTYKSCVKTRWNCKCECGGKTIALTQDLLRGHTRSCGCYQRQRTSEASVTHGMRHKKIYHTWLDMKNRCNNRRYKRYKDWGGRGIRVCEIWERDFMEFYNHVSALPHYGEEGMTLDRINNDGNYEPGNVRWATRKEQNNNKRTTRKEGKNGIKSTGIQSA